VRNIVKLSKDKDDLLLDLQNQVELRTVHLENANKRLSDLAHHDPLTGLFNRLRLEKDMQTFIDQYLIHRSHFAVLMLDVDWFKKVNDSYGHEIGDFVLKELAKIFHAVCRDEDKIYRAGGEEFVILLDQISYADAYKVAKKINQKIEKHEFKKGNLSFYKTVSIGMCHSSILFDEDYKVMLRAADMGLYQAKENGRNRIEVATKAS
jgi:diguanylate cyclase (GGDEF)-like protein